MWRATITISLDDSEDATTTCSSSCCSRLCVSLVRDEEVDIDKQEDANTEPTLKLKTIIALTHFSPSYFPPAHMPSSSNTNAIHEIRSFLILDLFVNYKNQDISKRQVQEPGYYWPILSKLASNFQAMKLESFFLSSCDAAIFSAQSSSSFSNL